MSDEEERAFQQAIAIALELDAPERERRKQEQGKRLRAKYFEATPEGSPEIAALDAERRLHPLVVDGKRRPGWYRDRQRLHYVVHWGVGEFHRRRPSILCGFSPKLMSLHTEPDKYGGPIYCLRCVELLRKLRNG